MFIVTERDQIKRTLRRLLADEPVKLALAKNLVDGANPVGPFRMSRRREMIEACRMGQKKCGHALSWRVRGAFEKGLT
jgi:hypothetical protein